MADEAFDVRKVIEQSASKTTLQELAKKGIHRVKVLDEQMINKLILDAVKNTVGANLSDAERDAMVRKSRAELDKLIKEVSQHKDKAELLASDKTTLAAEVENLQKQLQLQRQLTEAEFNKKIMGEMQKNMELSQKLAKTLEDMRTRDDEIAKKMEQLFTKSIEGLSKKLSDLRLRSIAGGGGIGGGEGEEAFRNSADVISHMLSGELESNVKKMEQTEGKTAGTLGSALERLKAMRGGGGGGAAPAPEADKDKK